MLQAVHRDDPDSVERARTATQLGSAVEHDVLQRGALPRFGRYRVRLTEALDRARGGALEHLTDTTTSYHNVWFQLHEDLLATLGIPR